MLASDALWSQELRYHALSTTKFMHDYFAFLHDSGWYDVVVERALDEVLDFLVTEDAPHATHLPEIKLKLVQLKPEQVGNALFRFILSDTLERISTPNAEPWHWATYCYFWFQWRGETRSIMQQALSELPEFIEE